MRGSLTVRGASKCGAAKFDFERDLVSRRLRRTAEPTTNKFVGANRLNKLTTTTKLSAGIFSPFTRHPLPLLNFRPTNNLVSGGALLLAQTDSSSFIDNPFIAGITGLLVVTGISALIAALFKSNGRRALTKTAFQNPSTNPATQPSEPKFPFVFGTLDELAQQLEVWLGPQITGVNPPIARTWGSNANGTAPLTAFQFKDKEGNHVIVIAGDGLNSPQFPGIQMQQHTFGANGNHSGSYHAGHIGEGSSGPSPDVRIEQLLMKLAKHLGGTTLPGPLPRTALLRAVSDWNNFSKKVQEQIRQQYMRLTGLTSESFMVEVAENAESLAVTDGIPIQWLLNRASDIIFARVRYNERSAGKMVEVWDNGAGISVDNPAFFYKPGASYQLDEVFGSRKSERPPNEFYWVVLGMLKNSIGIRTDGRELWIATHLRDALRAVRNQPVETDKPLSDRPFLELTVNGRALFWDMRPLERHIRERISNATPDPVSMLLKRWFKKTLSLGGAVATEYVPREKLPVIALDDVGGLLDFATFGQMKKRIERVYGRGGKRTNIASPAVKSWTTWNGGQLVIHVLNDGIKARDYYEDARLLGIQDVLPTGDFKYAVLARGYDRNAGKNPDNTVGYDVVWFFGDNEAPLSASVLKWTWDKEGNATSKTVLLHDRK